MRTSATKQHNLLGVKIFRSEFLIDIFISVLHICTFQQISQKFQADILPNDGAVRRGVGVDQGSLTDIGYMAPDSSYMALAVVTWSRQ